MLYSDLCHYEVNLTANLKQTLTQNISTVNHYIIYAWNIVISLEETINEAYNYIEYQIVLLSEE
jgi:hypothetical protein